MTFPQFIEIAGLRSLHFALAWFVVSVVAVGIYAVASIMWGRK